MTRCSSVAHTAISLFLLVTSVRAHAAGFDEKIPFNIAPETSLYDALMSIAHRADMHPSVDGSYLAGRTTRGLQGMFSPREALAIVLKEHDLTYTLDRNRVTVTPIIHTAVLPQAQLPDVSAPTAAAAPEVNQIMIWASRPAGNDLLVPALTTIHRADIERSGYLTAGEFLGSVPQNAAPSGNLGAIPTGAQIIPSQAPSTIVSLRGLGGDSTAVTINGHRVATSEATGGVDITPIPLSAIERIEILPDGASAEYGSDAVAGVVNLVMRDQYQGSEISSTMGGAVEGGGFLQQYNATRGGNWGGQHVFATVNGTWQNDIDSSQRSFVPASIAGTTLLPSTKRWSILLGSKGRVHDELETSFQGFYASRDNFQAQNLGQQAPGLATQARAHVEQYLVAGDLTAPIFNGWKGIVSADMSSDMATSWRLVTQMRIPDHCDR